MNLAEFYAGRRVMITGGLGFMAATSPTPSPG